MLSNRVAVVVPTFGDRAEYLVECLESIVQAGNPHICIVAPPLFEIPKDFQTLPNLQIEIDAGLGLPHAINQGVMALPENIEYVGWLGDDDLLSHRSIDELVDELDSDPSASLVFGSCRYIGKTGKELFTSTWGRWAEKLLNFGPDLIPQPGSLFRKKSFIEVGGLRSEYELAFDFDLFLRLKKVGRLKYLPSVVSSFRWHPDSLTVKSRRKAVLEASRARVSHLPRGLQSICFLWEYPVRAVTLIAGYRISAIARKRDTGN